METLGKTSENDGGSTMTAAARREAEADNHHLKLIFLILRVLVAIVTVGYLALIGVLCLHWLHAGDRSVLGLALLPVLLLLVLNAAVWMAGKTT